MSSDAIPSALKEFPVVLELPVQWSDIDAYGHVNNVAHLRWFESVRAVYGGRVGVDVVRRESGVGAVVADLWCKYLRQPSFPGSVCCGVRITAVSIGSVSIKFCTVDRSTGIPAAEGGCHAVLVEHATGRPIPVPDRIRSAVETLEGTRFPVE